MTDDDDDDDDDVAYVDKRKSSVCLPSYLLLRRH